MRARTTLGIIAMMVLANTVLGVDILVSALLAALLVLLARCVHVSDLRRSVDLRLTVVIACSFALGAAPVKTGVAAVAADYLHGWAGADPFMTLVLLSVAPGVFTQLATNHATATLGCTGRHSGAGGVGGDP